MHILFPRLHPDTWTLDASLLLLSPFFASLLVPAFLSCTLPSFYAPQSDLCCTTYARIVLHFSTFAAASHQPRPPSLSLSPHHLHAHTILFGCPLSFPPRALVSRPVHLVAPLQLRSSCGCVGPVTVGTSWLSALLTYGPFPFRPLASSISKGEVDRPTACEHSTAFLLRQDLVEGFTTSLNLRISLRTLAENIGRNRLII